MKHCPVACFAPSDSIVEKLNDQRLGASVAEALADDEPLDEPVSAPFRRSLTATD